MATISCLQGQHLEISTTTNDFLHAVSRASIKFFKSRQGAQKGASMVNEMVYIILTSILLSIQSLKLLYAETVLSKMERNVTVAGKKTV